MGPFNIFKKSTKPTASENYLTLTLTPAEVQATIWAFNQEKIEIKAFAKKGFANPDNLTHQAAIAIDNAAASAKCDVEKVVFGLSDYYLDGAKPTPETAKILKNLASDLELNAQAYVQSAIAINHLLKVEGDITPHALLIGIFPSFFEINLIKNNAVEKEVNFKEEASAEKIATAIGGLKQEDSQLPARIVIYGNLDEKLLEKLAHFNWSNIFMHEPKIDILEEEELGKSVAYASAADILGHEPLTPEVAENKEEEKPQVEPNAFGFVAGEDVLLNSSLESDEKEEDLAAVTKEVQEETKSQAKAVEQQNIRPVPPQTAENLAFEPSTTRAEPKPKGPSKISRILLKMNFFSGFRLRGKKLLITVGIFLFLVVAGAYAAGQLLTQAEVLIKVNAKQEEKDFIAKVVLGGTYDTSSSQIPGAELKESAQGSQKAVATGSKKTGTKAKGEIKILNWGEPSKTFSSGTEVITKDGLKFTIDGEIQVASRSSTPGEERPGEAKVGATAVDIGPKYNIGSGTSLTIVGFDDVFYSAVTSTDISGGDEKQSTVVSAEDLTRLEKSLTDSLTQKAKQNLKDKNPNFKIDEGTLTTKVLKKDFDKKQDEEASLVNLNMEVEVSTIAYSEEDLKKLLSEIASQTSSQDLEARGENIEIADLATTRTKDVLNLKGKERIGFTPKINEIDLAVKIAGKSVKEARGVIMEIKSVSDVQVKFTPGFLFADTIPRNKAKIKFKIET